MKFFKYSIAVVLVAMILHGCKKDNYDEPSSLLSGRFHYQGEPIHVEYNRVPFELYQYGFGKVGPINGTITPEGTYSHMLFDGQYRLVVRGGQGPFLWPATGGKQDSILIDVRGNTNRDIEVRPYYMIRTPQMTLAAGKVTGNFKIEQIITDADAKTIERAALFINKTIFVGVDNNIARVDITGANITDPNNVSLEVSVPGITPTQNYVFARIGVKASGVEDWIFSEVKKISL
jgi:Domain of unknown function (DUF3823_C)/Protein of unknown function (DUF3823) N-terminal domain